VPWVNIPDPLCTASTVSQLRMAMVSLCVQVVGAVPGDVRLRHGVPLRCWRRVPRLALHVQLRLLEQRIRLHADICLVCVGSCQYRVRRLDVVLLCRSSVAFVIYCCGQSIILCGAVAVSLPVVTLTF
jgi:hypothetical protein